MPVFVIESNPDLLNISVHGHHTVGASVFILGEINDVVVESKGYTPSCFTSWSLDKARGEPLQERKHGFNPSLYFSLAFPPARWISKSLFNQNKTNSSRCLFLLNTSYLSLGTVVTKASRYTLCCRGKICSYGDDKIILKNNNKKNLTVENIPLQGYENLICHLIHFAR